MSEKPDNEEKSPIEKQTKEGWGSWSHRSNRKSNDGLSRRDFNKFLTSLGLGTVISELGLGHLKAEQNENHPVIETVIIDFFESETSEETLDRLLQSASIELDLNNISYSDLDPTDPARIALESYTNLGEIKPVMRWAVNSILEVVSEHGQFVKSKYEEYGQSSNSQLKTVGLQNVLDNLLIKNDLLGNITITGEVSVQMLVDLLRESEFNEDSVLIGAFQFGVIEAGNDFFTVDPQVNLVDSSNYSELYAVWGPEVEGATLTYSSGVDDNGDPIIRANYQDGSSAIVSQEYITLYEGNLNSPEEIDEFQFQVFNQAKNHIASQIEELGHVSDEFAPYIKVLGNRDRVRYVEPYNNPENLEKYKEFCTAFPETLIVQAAGNNSDLRGWGGERPENGILVSGIGGELRSSKFGTDPSRRVGGIGADIYVSFKDIHDIEISTMTSSESTAIIGAYCENLKKLGVSTREIKRVLQERCCDYFTQDDNNFELQVTEGEYLSGYVFNKEKADQYILELRES